MTTAHTACRGLTLVELLVAVLISTLATAGAVRTFIAGRALHQRTDATARLAEQGLFVLGVLEPDVQMAGYYGLGALPAPVFDAPVPAGAAACGPTLPTALDQPVAIGDGRYPLACAAAGGGAASGTDLLVLRRASARAAVPTAGRLQVLGGRSHAAGAVVSATAAQPLRHADGVDERRDLLVRAYYIARSADGTPELPALRVKSLTAIDGQAAFVDTEVLPGVEDLQAEVGYIGADGELRFAATPPAGSTARALRLWLLLRGAAREAGGATTQHFGYAGREVRFRDGVPRRLVERLFVLRNATDASP